MIPDHDQVAQGTGNSLAAPARSPGEASSALAEAPSAAPALPGGPQPGHSPALTAASEPPCFQEPVTFGLVV